MKNQHVLLLIKETKYYSVHCHALEPSNFMTILNSKAQGDPIQCSTSSREKYTSPDIQDEIIYIIKNQMCTAIVCS